jgi:putative endonuclease
MINRRKSGADGENLAVDFLRKKGYRILEQNFRFERGEIDIIAEESETLVFVEVKARRSKTFGDPEDAVTEHKRSQIRRIAEGYLFKKNIEEKACRFDVIAIQYHDGEVDIRHLENAF